MGVRKFSLTANSLFKFIFDIGITVLWAKCASLTGSTSLTIISLRFGIGKILKILKKNL